jgi:protein gp37
MPMGDHSAIEWTDATWNPVRGCAIVSKGCTNCYAMRQAHRSSGAGGAYEGLTKRSKGGPVWTGKVRLVPELLEQPLQWRRPRRIFVNSMSDLFHEDVPVDFIYRLWCTMAAARRHRFQILTKRGARMREVLTGRDVQERQVLDNVWLGVSVEDQVAADERIPQLLETPAAVRWISAEPLLGLIDLVGKDAQGSALHTC